MTRASIGRGPKRLRRRDFLKVGGAGLVSAMSFAGTWPKVASAQEVRGESSIADEFREAGEKYDVPAALLLAMGYVNTRLEMPSAKASEYERGSPHGWGGYGIMHLTQNPTTDTLGEASRLTGIPESELKIDRRANIMGGAALLAASQGRIKPAGLGGWSGAVGGREERPGGRRLVAPSGVGGGRLYADQVLEALRYGISARTRSGESVSLQPQRGF